jgi:phosphate acetyltransferase
MFMDKLVRNAKKLNKTIVLCDSELEAMSKAVIDIMNNNLCNLILVGNEDKIIKQLEKQGLDSVKTKKGLEVVDPRYYKFIDDFAKDFAKMRKKKGYDISFDEAKGFMQKSNYIGAMIVYKGYADGMISGLSSENKPFLPAFRIVGVKGNSKVSSFFMMIPPANYLSKEEVNGLPEQFSVMKKQKNVLFYSDCGLNINPDEKLLGEIAIQTINSAMSFGIKPKVSMLSFSTQGTAKGPLVDKVVNATRVANRKLNALKKKDDKYKDVLIEGEVQFDAAMLDFVAKKKLKQSKIMGKSNVLIFPDLNVGNIGYKMTERLGGYVAIGPVLQGLKKPVNDLSRGANAKDIYYMTAVTCLQSE